MPKIHHSHGQHTFHIACMFYLYWGDATFYLHRWFQHVWLLQKHNSPSPMAHNTFSSIPNFFISVLHEPYNVIIKVRLSTAWNVGRYLGLLYFITWSTLWFIIQCLFGRYIKIYFKWTPCEVINFENVHPMILGYIIRSRLSKCIQRSTYIFVQSLSRFSCACAP